MVAWNFIFDKKDLDKIETRKTKLELSLLNLCVKCNEQEILKILKFSTFFLSIALFCHISSAKK